MKNCMSEYIVLEHPLHRVCSVMYLNILSFHNRWIGSWPRPLGLEGSAAWKVLSLFLWLLRFLLAVLNSPFDVIHTPKYLYALTLSSGIPSQKNGSLSWLLPNMQILVFSVLILRFHLWQNICRELRCFLKPFALEDKSKLRIKGHPALHSLECDFEFMFIQRWISWTRCKATSCCGYS